MVVLAAVAAHLAEAVVVAALGQAAAVALEGLAARRLVLETAVPLAEVEVAEELTTAAETPVAAEAVAAPAALVLLQTTVASTVLQRRVLRVIRALAVVAIRSATSAVSASRADLTMMIKLILSAESVTGVPAIVPMVLNASIVSPATRMVNVKVMTADAWNAVPVVDHALAVNLHKLKPVCLTTVALCPGKKVAWLNAEPLSLRHVMRYALRPTVSQGPATATAMTNAVTARSVTLHANACLIQGAIRCRRRDVLGTLPQHWFCHGRLP